MLPLTQAASLLNSNNPLVNQLKTLAMQLPAHLLKPLNWLPEALSEQVLTLSLNQLFKVSLAEQELNFLSGKYLKLIVTDAGFSCFISVIAESNDNAVISVSSALPTERASADVEFSADTLSLMLMASKRVDPDTLFFQRKLLVTGQTALGLAIKNFLDDFDFHANMPKAVRFGLQQLQQVATPSANTK